MMKYPKLTPDQDLRRKLMDEDIADIRQAYEDALPFPSKSEVLRALGTGHAMESEHRWMRDVAEMYGVSYSTISYYVNDEYHAKMLTKNAKAHNKANMDDYEAHRAAEVKRRVERWDRNDDLREWHYRVSAKHEKRAKRITVLGKPLDDKETE